MIEVCTFMAEFITLFVMIAKLLGVRFRVDAVTIVTFIINISLVDLINHKHIPSECIVIVYLLTLGYVLVEYNERLIKKFAAYVGAYFLICILQFSVAIIVYQLVYEGMNNSIVGLIVTFIVMIVVLIISYTMPEFKWKKIIEIIIDNRLVVALYGVQIAIMLIIVKMKRSVDVVYCIAILLFSLIMLTFIRKLDKHKLEIENIKKDQHIDKVYNEAFVEMINEIRRKQHNFENHVHALTAFYENAESLDNLKADIEDYKNEIKKDNKFNKMLQLKSSPVIIGFLYNKFTEAENRKIDITQHIVIGEAKCRLNQYKIIEILGVLIDNAVESFSLNSKRELEQCGYKNVKQNEFKLNEYEYKQVEQKNIKYNPPENKDNGQKKFFQQEIEQNDLNHIEKHIIVEMIEYSDKLEILVKNRHEYIRISEIELFFKEGFSTKGENRGLGLYSVKEQVGKVKGTLEADNEKINSKNYFVIKVSIPI